MLKYGRPSLQISKVAARAGELLLGAKAKFSELQARDWGLAFSIIGNWAGKRVMPTAQDATNHPGIHKRGRPLSCCRVRSYWSCRIDSPRHPHSFTIPSSMLLKWALSVVCGLCSLNRDGSVSCHKRHPLIEVVRFGLGPCMNLVLSACLKAGKQENIEVPLQPSENAAPYPARMVIEQRNRLTR